MKKNDNREGHKLNYKKLLLMLLISGIGALIIAYFVPENIWGSDRVQLSNGDKSLRLIAERAYVIFFVLLYASIHLIVPIKEIYSWMFQKRWILGGILLVFLTINRYHGDSIEYYNNMIQPGQETLYSKPIFGKLRAIRSDEFVVNTPATLASSYGEDPFGKYTNVLRGEDTLNIVAGAYGGYATLAYAPWELSYLVLPLEYAFSFSWYAPLVLAFLIAIEFCYILSKGKKLLAVAGGFLTVCSSFFLWWSFPSLLIAAPGTIVCVNYFLSAKTKGKRVLCGIGTALCFANFVITLYPAWQVPLGYMFLVIGIWVIKKNWRNIRELDRNDWFIFGGCVVFMISLIVAYFCISSEYLRAVTETVYPGARRESGGMALQKIFYYAQAPFYAYRELPNPSELGVFLSFFPIPTLMGAYYWIKSKEKDFLIASLILIEVPMLLYVTTGLPEIVARISLFENSTPERVVDIIGLLQIYLLMILLSKKDSGMGKGIAVILSAGVTCAAVLVSSAYNPGYLSTINKLAMTIVIFALSLGITMKISKRKQAVVLIAIICLSIFTGIQIRPVSKGLDAIYAKPVSMKIREISANDKSGKWITLGGGSVLPAFNVACGAPTINSVNFYPNMELWNKLDESGKYEEVYNRYAHIELEMTKQDTKFKEIRPDLIQLKLSYEDIKKTEAKYLLALNVPESELANEYVEFDKVYEENGASIYQIMYK